ncbi:unnamed protein product [Closterium sp. NIES-54]
MASCVLISGLPRSFPPLPPGPAPTCVPCVEGRQRAAPHSSEFPPTEALLHTLHMDVWGPARVRGQGHERYFLLVVDDYLRYTTVFPLRRKDEVTEVLIDWIRVARLQLRERFGSDFPVLRLHCDRGGEFSSDLLRAFCRAEGIRQTFTLPASPQQNGIAERRIGMYAVHQINLQPRVSLPETSPTLWWTGKVGDASAFRVWGSRAFVRDLSADKLSSCAVPCVFLGFPLDALGWQFYHPTSRRVLSSHDVTFDESGPAPSGVSQVEAVEPVKVAVDSGTFGGAEPERAKPGGAGPAGAEPESAVPGGAGSGGAEPERAEPAGAGSGGAEPGVAESGGAAPAGAGPGAGGAAGAGGSPSAGGAGATGPGGARTGGTGAAGPGGATGAGAVASAGGHAGAGAAGGTGAGGAARAGALVGAGVGASGAAGGTTVAGGAAGAGAEAGGAGVVPAGSRGAARPRLYFVPLLEQVLGLPPSSDPAPTLECPPSVPSESHIQLASPLPAPSPYAGPTGGLTERRDPDAPDIPTLRSYAEAIEGPYSSQWQAAMDAEMASWKSTDTYVDEVPPPGANIVSGMWIFRVKRPPGFPPVFKARYVARGFSQRQGVDYFQTFSPTPKMTTLRVLLHVAAQRDYELHSLDFSTAFLQGSLHEEIWLRRPPGFTGSFPPVTQCSLRQLLLGLLLLLPPFYILVYIDDLVFATADTEALAHVKSELQKRHTCTDLGEQRNYLGLQITRDRARRTITLTQSHMVQQVLQRFDFTYSSPQATPLSTRHSLSALPSDESVEPSGPYPELVGCLMYLMTCTRPDLAYPLSILARYVAPGRHRPEHMAAAKRVLRYLCSTSGMGLVLGGRSPVVLTGHADASWVDDLPTWPHLFTS